MKKGEYKVVGKIIVPQIQIEVGRALNGKYRDEAYKLLQPFIDWALKKKRIKPIK